MIGYLACFVIVLCIFVVLSISSFFVKTITKPVVPTLEESKEKEFGRISWDGYDKISKKKIEIKGFDGYKLHGEVWEIPGRPFVVVTHGYTSTRYGALKYAQIYYELGYQVIIYDIRFHGENTGGYCSMGFLETKDLLAVISWVRNQYGEHSQIGLHGESLGSSVTIQALKYEQNLSFVVSDCGFSDLQELMEYQAHVRFHLPGFLARTTSCLNGILHGYRFFDMKPISALAENNVPILFIHGEEDDFIPSDMCRRMYEQTTAKKKIMLFPGAEHAESYYSNPAYYRQCVTEFIRELEIQEY